MYDVQTSRATVTSEVIRTGVKHLTPTWVSKPGGAKKKQGNSKLNHLVGHLIIGDFIIQKSLKSEFDFETIFPNNAWVGM